MQAQGAGDGLKRCPKLIGFIGSLFLGCARLLGSGGLVLEGAGSLLGIRGELLLGVAKRLGRSGSLCSLYARARERSGVDAKAKFEVLCHALPVRCGFAFAVQIRRIKLADRVHLPRIEAHPGEPAVRVDFVP